MKKVSSWNLILVAPLEFMPGTAKIYSQILASIFGARMPSERQVPQEAIKSIQWPMSAKQRNKKLIAQPKKRIKVVLTLLCRAIRLHWQRQFSTKENSSFWRTAMLVDQQRKTRDTFPPFHNPRPHYKQDPVVRTTLV